METRFYIMCADVFDSPAQFQAAFSALSYERREKIMRFHLPKDRYLSLAAGILIDYGLRQYGLHEKNMQYGYGKNEKSYFKGCKELNY